MYTIPQLLKFTYDISHIFKLVRKDSDDYVSISSLYEKEENVKRTLVKIKKSMKSVKAC